MTSTGKKQVNQETVIIIALVALLCGFLGGVVFSAFKTSPTSSHQHSDHQTQEKQPAMSQQQINDIMALEQKVAADPQNVVAWTQLGHLYFDTQDLENAIRAYTKSLELAPEQPNVLTDLGVMYRRNGDPEKALETFSKAAEVDGRHEQSRFNKGVVLLYDFNDKEGAIAAWEDLLKINPAALSPSGDPIKDVIAKVREES